MPSAKEIKSRIASIKDTQKITNAMYLISSTKLRRICLIFAFEDYISVTTSNIQSLFESKRECFVVNFHNSIAATYVKNADFTTCSKIRSF